MPLSRRIWAVALLMAISAAASWQVQAWRHGLAFERQAARHSALLNRQSQEHRANTGPNRTGAGRWSNSFTPAINSTRGS